MKLKLLLLAMAGVVSHAHAEITNINDDELLRLQARGVPVVDIRTADEWRETGVIQGAHLLTYSFSGTFDKSTWLKQLHAIAKPGEPIILVCRSGRRSAAVAQFIDGQPTKTKVYNASGGMNVWKSSGRPIVAP